MPEYTLEELVKRALSLGILDLEQIQEVWKILGTHSVSVDQFLQTTLRHGMLTKYQADRLKLGETTGFFYGDYKVLYLVGAGSFARVYRAVHKVTKKVVALKVLRARFSQDKSAIEQFVREMELSQDLHHPNIVVVHELVSNKSDHYMVMDFVEGQTLREFLNVQKNKMVNPKVATRIIIDICKALDYAFKRGHSHRDMKLSNVILSSSGKAVLVDFGLGATDKELETDIKNQRAVDYAALEKLSGVPRNDKRSDIYFLGTMFYHLLTGVSPLLETTDRAKRMERTRFMNIRPLRERNPGIPGILSIIVERAMSFDPDRRYQTPEEMLNDLENAVPRLDAETISTAVQPSLIDEENKKKEPQKTILVVEGNPEMQNIFRSSLKNEGFRVLMMTDLARMLERFESGNSDVDCVLINAQYLGPESVLAFNQLVLMPISQGVRTVLLLDERQVKWSGKTLRCKYRVTVGMPIAMSRLLMFIKKLVATPVNPTDGERLARLYRDKKAAAGQRAEDPNKKVSQIIKEMSEKKKAPSQSDDDIFSSAFDAAVDDFMSSLDLPQGEKK